MADALLSPAVGGTLWAVSGGLIAFCARKVKQTMQDHLVPLMGVMGAFVFAGQMINFSIPGTGSSGHLCGGLMLAILLGPWAAFLVIASILTIQSLFFADGGVLALGCNIFNMGFLPVFVAYPLYKLITKGRHGSPLAWAASIVSAVIGLVLGAFGVVLETTASGISELPFGSFVLVMLPIHLAIGLVEGLATATVVSFVFRARPEILQAEPEAGIRIRPILVGLAVAALVIGGAFSWFASTHPDGLEWSVVRVSGSEEVAGSNAEIHQHLAGFQRKVAFLPDYGFKAGEAEEEACDAWPSVSAGATVSGLVGGSLTLGLVVLTGLALRLRPVRQAK
ncbi:MAG: energy-coupling factor ABC transporter permease [Pontiellaceae bacterium]|nr:energy-coupling factor ABC transporter permease [Pontiellaceae bacterium]MBN2785708.1 energy-coupling factor ABC transporter permease [Pontiellaceae bacterium]